MKYLIPLICFACCVTSLGCLHNEDAAPLQTKRDRFTDKAVNRPLIPFLSLLDEGGKIAICRVESAVYHDNDSFTDGRIVLSLVKPLYGKTPDQFSVNLRIRRSQTERSSDYVIDRWSGDIPQSGDVWLVFLERENVDSIILPPDSSSEKTDSLQVFNARDLRDAKIAGTVEKIISLYQLRGSKEEFQKLIDAIQFHDIDIEMYIGELIVKHLVEENRPAAKQLQSLLISAIQNRAL